MSTDPFWSGVERLSSLVAIVGLPLAILGASLALYQLRALLREQRRIGAELAKQPKPLVGFLPLIEKGGKKSLSQEADVTATYLAGQTFSAPVEITIACHNAGTRSAREILYNFTFAKEFLYLASESQTPNRGMITANPSNGLPLWLIKDDRMHPGDSSWFTLPIKIPVGMALIHIDTEVSLQDHPGMKAQLRLVVHRADKVDPALRMPTSNRSAPLG